MTWVSGHRSRALCSHQPAMTVQLLSLSGATHKLLLIRVPRTSQALSRQ